MDEKDKEEQRQEAAEMEARRRETMGSEAETKKTSGFLKLVKRTASLSQVTESSKGGKPSPPPLDSHPSTIDSSPMCQPPPPPTTDCISGASPSGVQCQGNSPAASSDRAGGVSGSPSSRSRLSQRSSQSP